ncbi:MAG TPA: hypothetical protein VGV09_20565, partial [Steroidobacteraceae bacterium]|nr:hypothetical protein [Steroidobacteraceae bacterium]
PAPPSPAVAQALRSAGIDTRVTPAAANLHVRLGALHPATHTYEVTMKPATQQVDADTMQKSYLGATAQGELIFDARTAPAVANLKPGTVTVFAGTALLKVTGVIRRGDFIAVSGVPAGLEDAIDHGRIGWTTTLDYTKVAFQPPPGFHRVRFLAGLIRPANAEDSAGGNSFEGDIKGFKVILQLTPARDNLHVDLHATRNISGGIVEVHAVGQINGLTNETLITLANGTTTQVTFDNNGLSGSVDFDWNVGFDAQHGGDDKELLKSAVENLPFSFEVPLDVGPIPFLVTIKAGFSFQAAFSSKATVASGSYHASFGGNVPNTVGAGGGDGAAVVSGDGQIKTHGGTVSLAPVGLTTIAALPKVSLTLGLPENLLSFMKTPELGGPYATFMVRADFIATGAMSVAQCERRVLYVMVFAGYEPGVLGLLFKDPAKKLFERRVTQVTPSNITLCQDKSS